jgi:hypothetical protein
MFESQNGNSQIQRAQPKPKGKYTGERMKPAKLQAIVNALSIGEPIQSIAARLHSSTSTVIATRERESLDIERRKQLIRASAARLAANGFDKLNREMDAGRINGALLVPVTGMATDKVIALSSNDPLSGVQQHLHLHLQPNDVTSNFNNLLRSLEEKARALPPSPPPALTDERTDTEQRESLRE